MARKPARRSIGAGCIALLATAVVLVAAGCGSDSSEGTTATGATADGGPTGKVPATEISVGHPLGPTGETPVAGAVLAGFVGNTLYTFGKDEQDGETSACYGSCAEVWFPLVLEGEVKAVRGADQSMTGSFRRKDGTTQATYNGWPLYTLAGEPTARALAVGRKSFGAPWYPLHPNGELAVP